MAVEPVLWLDGRFVSGDSASLLRSAAYGAYTSFRVEEGAVRGLDLHLDRLEHSAQFLFGGKLDRESVRSGLIQATDGQGDGWARISLFSDAITPRTPDAKVSPDILIAFGPAPAPISGHMRCRAMVLERYAPEIKHIAIFELVHARREAKLSGYDDTVFIDHSGAITEGSLWNIGFVRGGEVIWPLGRKLEGVAQQLIQQNLDALGINQRSERVELTDLARMDAAFLCNSATPCASISSIDGHGFQGAEPVLEMVAKAWLASMPQPLKP